jgi:ribosome maturation factor RimP
MGIGFDPKKKYEEIITYAAENCGFNVYERVIRLKGENTKITVKIDSPNGISHDDCHRYSNELSRMLDEDGSVPNYMLEISSPGLDRQLVTREDFIRFTGSPVKVIYESEKGGRAVKGPLLSADENGITVHVTEEKRTIAIPFHSIKGANLDY